MQSAAPIQAVFFDLDGTLLDSAKICDQTFRATLCEAAGQKTQPGVVFPYIGKPTEVILGNFVPEPRIPELAKIWMQKFQAMARQELRLFPGLLPLLQDMHRAGLKLAAVTTQSDHECIVRHMNLGIEKLMDLWVTSNLVARVKPAPDGINLALKHFRLTPADVVMVGDTFNDLEAGRAAGVRTAAVTWGFGKQEDLLACKPTYVFHSPADLRRLLSLAAPLPASAGRGSEPQPFTPTSQ